MSADRQTIVDYKFSLLKLLFVAESHAV